MCVDYLRASNSTTASSCGAAKMHVSACVPSSGAYNSITTSSYERLRPHGQELGRTGWGGIKHIRRLQRDALAISDLVDVKSLVYELILSIGHVR